MQSLHGRIAGDDKIRVVAEPLQAAIPNISMDIVVGARGQPKKFNVPQAAKTSPTTTTRRGNSGVAKNSRTANRYAMPAKVIRGHEVRPASIAEVA